MNEQEFDFLVFIGRFQPFHLGHVKIIREGLAKAAEMIVLCGSAHQPRSTRNPWSSSEREQMIRGAFSAEENERIHIVPLMDMVYNDEAWVRGVQAAVNGLVAAYHGRPHVTPRIGLIGHSKDHSSFYLNLFPQWGNVAVNNHQQINATNIRHAVLEGNLDSVLSQLPGNVGELLTEFQASETLADIREEHAFVNRYKASWQAAPYEPTFVTVDAVLVQSGHVLMVERKARPGRGLLALPGGFVETDERLLDAALRELREETRVKVPEPVLKGSLGGQKVFDDPHRSARGRTITHAFYIELNPSDKLPKVKGSDDARRALWVPLAELDPTTIFEDHYFIIAEMTGIGSS
jgi:bifunctional NMN adenylyltransferase/nudix hydrolase